MDLILQGEVMINTTNITNATVLNQKLINSMLLNMRFVSFMCNFWTIVLSLVSMIQIAK